MNMEIKVVLLSVCIVGLTLTIGNWYFYRKYKTGWLLFASIAATVYTVMLLSIFWKYHYLQYELFQYDINKNGIFEINEQNETQQVLREEYLNDTRVNFSPFFAIIPSLLISLLLLLLWKLFRLKQIAKK